ncbi:TetR/AcrR family transcriptional regulator [Actinomadura alba]|uniref:TetR family transcriptional regulator n=1 Tax=Actinomadura alba TaxID=406431 RepID=A0ABR7LPK1_9ACTN|nr:TetR family transcriptional regulator [Actinomadura alba]MBC6466774.1 TetR family transcriptional regulator [Actinomadura alba]
MSTAPPPSSTADQLPLRERKKLRTRQTLIDTALERFTTDGFDGTTLDRLCAAVEVSKRTFFRYFSSKEDVAMAPTQDLWTAFLDDLEIREPDHQTLLAMLQDTLLAALERMPDEGWAHRVLLSHRLTATTPSMDAHGLQFCDRTSRQAMTLLGRRFELADPQGLSSRLALDLLVAAFHRALERWAAEPGTPPARDDLAVHVRDAFAAIPGSLTLRVEPRSERR